MNPRLILAVIAGGVTGTFTFSLFHAGLVAPPSPGSIFAYIAMAPKGGMLPIFSGVITSTIVSFGVGALLLKTTKQTASEDLEQATARMKEMKQAPAAAAAEWLDVPVTKPNSIGSGSGHTDWIRGWPFASKRANQLR